MIVSARAGRISEGGGVPSAGGYSIVGGVCDWHDFDARRGVVSGLKLKF